MLALIVWDVIAVLTPCGPLGYIMREETARALAIQEREQSRVRAREQGGTEDDDLPGMRLPPGLLYEGDLFRLGTGDMLFYCVLVGRAAMSDWETFVMVLVAVLAGLAVTIGISFATKLVVPALPAALVFGVVAYFASSFAASDFLRWMQSQGYGL